MKTYLQKKQELNSFKNPIVDGLIKCTSGALNKSSILENIFVCSAYERDCDNNIQKLFNEYLKQWGWKASFKLQYKIDKKGNRYSQKIFHIFINPIEEEDVSISKGSI